MARALHKGIPKTKHSEGRCNSSKCNTCLTALVARVGRPMAQMRMRMRAHKEALVAERAALCAVCEGFSHGCTVCR